MVRILFLMVIFGTMCIEAQDSQTQVENIHSSLPVVDLQDYFNPLKRDQFIEQVKEACHKVGFFAVINTGANQEITSNMYASSKEFFAYPKEMKMQIDGAHTNTERGYTAKGSTTQKDTKTFDFKEYFTMGREFSKEEADRLMVWQNMWPDFFNMETPSVAYYKHIYEYAEIFQEVFSLAIGEEKDYFGKLCKEGDTICRMIYYPRNKDKKEGDPRTIWSSAHTDIGLFTILPRATARGLEVRDQDGNWIPVCINTDAFIINVGDCLELCSNGYFRSSFHRVLEPENMKKDRYSSVMFVHPGSYERLIPLQRWIDEIGEKRFVEATRLEILNERFADMGVASPEALKQLADSKLLERLMTVGRASPEAMQALLDAGLASDEVKAALKK